MVCAFCRKDFSFRRKLSRNKTKIYIFKRRYTIKTFDESLRFCNGCYWYHKKFGTLIRKPRLTNEEKRNMWKKRYYKLKPLKKYLYDERTKAIAKMSAEDLAKMIMEELDEVKQ